jgi:hypothetical protein
MKKHDFFNLMGAVKESLARDYERIRARSRDDPGTAGDQAEEDWAAILRNWLPANYTVVTKGRIPFEDGTSSPQMDVLVLSPSYPRGLSNEKYIFSGGVVAAFECKLTLRKPDVRRAFEAAYKIKKKIKPRLGTPYGELNSPPIVGLLAHSQALGKGRGSWKLHETIEAFQDKFADHPRELLDIICVADTATLPLAKTVLMGPGLSKDETEELSERKIKGAVALMYVIQDEDRPNSGIDSTGEILAGLIYELTFRIAFEDSSIRPWADHLANLGFYGGIGRPIYCAEDTLSKLVRQKLRINGSESDRWSEWNRELP